MGVLSMVGLIGLALPANVHAQVIGTGITNAGYGINAVGGVSISADGQLANVDVARHNELAGIRLEAVPGVMNRANGLRKVSLARMDAALKDCLDAGKPIPEAMYCLAGLQQIRYVFLYPEKHDIVLAGPADGWKLDKRGNVVGATNGRPVLQLDDLLTALRAAGGNKPAVMSCSIDPTPEGLLRVRNLARHLQPNGNPEEAATAVEEQLGPQRISVHGVPEQSHFAAVMVAADYRMKRISMSLERAPIPGLPGFMDMAQGSGGGGMKNMLPRWWLEPSFEPLLRDEPGLSWELHGATVKTMAETDFFDANGIQHPTGKADALSQRWANLMTKRYDDLALADPVFGQLRSCMDLAVVAALLVKENLVQKAQTQLPLFTGTDGLPTVKFNAPKQVASKASLVHKKSWMVAAGGVSINPWKAVEKSEISSEVSAVRQKAVSQAPENWWWD
jgi:hypothetical protein